MFQRAMLASGAQHAARRLLLRSPAGESAVMPASKGSGVLFANGRLTLVRHNTPGPGCVPPMRYMSTFEQLTRFLFLCAVLLSYPTYVLMNVDSFRGKPRQPIYGLDFNDEVKEILAERKERRARGEQPILDPAWIKWINEKDRAKRLAAEAAAE